MEHVRLDKVPYMILSDAINICTQRQSIKDTTISTNIHLGRYANQLVGLTFFHQARSDHQQFCVSALDHQYCTNSCREVLHSQQHNGGASADLDSEAYGYPGLPTGCVLLLLQRHWATSSHGHESGERKPSSGHPAISSWKIWDAVGKIPRKPSSGHPAVSSGRFGMPGERFPDTQAC